MVQKFTKSFVSNAPMQNGISVLQLERKMEEISELLQAKLAPQLADDFGVNLKRLDIDAIEIDKESPDYAEFVLITKEQQKIQAEQIGRRANIDTDIYAEQGPLAAESQYIQAHAINKQTEVLKSAAVSMGTMGGMDMGGDSGLNPAGMMMGMAMGGAMGGQMANMMNGMNQQMQQIQQPMGQQMAPPPMPGAISYMIAVNGQQYGPYNMQQMQQMVQNGQMNPQTYVWKQGMTNWDMAGNVPELASLFGTVPPPMPGGMPPTPPSM